jgi:uncharacterized membrane protein
VPTFEGVIDAAFNQMRQHAAGMPAVLIRLAEDINQLEQQASGEQQRALKRHLELVTAAGRRSIAEPEDLKDLEARATTATSAGKKRATKS